MRFRRHLTVASATALLVVAAGLPAGAHPYFTDGATVPAGSLATVTLAMAHGCGTEDDAGGDPTTEVAVEVPEQVSYLEPGEVEGYEVSVEGEEGAAVPAVVTWTATDGGEAAPELTMDVVVDGEPGDEVFVRVFQGCEGFEYRWVGTPDDPADDPAVRLTLGEPDPEAPAPPAPTETAVPEPETPEEEVATDAGSPDADADVPPDDAEPTTVEELPTEPPEDEGGGTGWWPVVLGAAVLAGLGGLIGARRKPVLDPTARDDAGPGPSDPASRP